MSNVYVNQSTGTTPSGTLTLTQAGATGVAWNLTYLSVSQAGPTLGPNAKLTIYDGAVGGTVLFSVFLGGPQTASGTGSVGTTQQIPLPVDGSGRPCLQSLPGNAMNIQVVGTGGNQVSINARFTDGIPTAI